MATSPAPLLLHLLHLPALTVPDEGTATRGDGCGDSVFQTRPATGYGLNGR
uniref:Uncharacterized protein n=1 Tax=Oryza glaberrima TaxID=4538 RepID=I1QER9_ORYGL